MVYYPLVFGMVLSLLSLDLFVVDLSFLLSGLLNAELLLWLSDSSDAKLSLLTAKFSLLLLDLFNDELLNLIYARLSVEKYWQGTEVFRRYGGRRGMTFT